MHTKSDIPPAAAAARGRAKARGSKPRLAVAKLRAVQRIACALGSSLIHASAYALLVANAADIQSRQDELPTVTREPLIATAFFVEQRPEGPGDRLVNPQPTLLLVGAIHLPPPAIPAISAVAADSIEASRAIETPEDAALVERLQGIYVRQINARVARVLEEMTRSRSGEARSCMVNIIQSDAREVLDVSIEKCDRDENWQRQVVLAIRAASPLPAPPEGLAMGSYLTLDLSSM